MLESIFQKVSKSYKTRARKKHQTNNIQLVSFAEFRRHRALPVNKESWQSKTNVYSPTRALSVWRVGNLQTSDGHYIVWKCGDREK